MPNTIFYATRDPYELTKGCKVSTDIYPDNDIRYLDISLLRSGELIIGAGFFWDGPTGTPFHTDDFMRSSLVHDALYMLMRDGKLSTKYRKKIDLLLYRLCIEDGMSYLRAMIAYLATRLLGGIALSFDNRVGYGESKTS